MKSVLRYPTSGSTFGLTLLFQHVIFIPMIVFFIFFMRRTSTYTYAVLADYSAIIAGSLTLLAVIFFFFYEINLGEKISFALPIGFAVFPISLTVMTHGIAVFRTNALLPYEWEKYAKLVSQLYSIPFVILTALMIIMLKIIHKQKETSPF